MRGLELLHPPDARTHPELGALCVQIDKKWPELLAPVMAFLGSMETLRASGLAELAEVGYASRGRSRTLAASALRRSRASPKSASDRR